MRILILGGTMFLGPHLVRAARARGHELVLFHRGKTRPGLFPEVPEILGDRKTDEGLAALEGAGSVDAVIDTCGYIPRVVALSARRLAARAARYVFVSSVSVYKNWPEEPCEESSPLATLADPTVEEVTGETYGALKVLCEEAAAESFPGRALILRPGLIVGPEDPTDRFAYWPHRVARGGDVLAPGGVSTPVQFIDGRDLAEWTIRLLEAGKTGVYNADGPQRSLGTLLDVCRTVSGADANVVYVAESFLAERGVQPWSELPLWIPGLAQKPGQGATLRARALADGLTDRPLEETVRDTLAWDAARDPSGAWRATLTPEREAELLAAWREKG